MKIKSNQRVCFIGKTGSGKSYLANRLIRNFKKVLLYDPKHEHKKEFPKAKVTSKLSQVQKWLEEKEFFIIFQPFDVNAEKFNELCKIVFRKGNLIFVLDEVENLEFTYWHEKIIRMGRTRGVGIFHLIQRPCFIPSNYILSENEHFFLFKLSLKSDRKKVEGFIGERAEELRTIEEFHYLYYNVLDDEPKLHKPIRSKTFI